MKRYNRSSQLAILGATLMLGGCMSAGPFPSLAQRQAEREPLTDPVRLAPFIPNDEALRREIATILASARQGNRAFDAAFPSAEAAARSAGAPASDSWVEAQQQISRLETARTDTMRALGDLDQMALARSNLPTSADDSALLEASLAQVEELGRNQQLRIDRLKALTAR